VFDGIQITQQHLNVVDPVEAFVYMEIMNVKGILVEVNESIQTIINILNGSAMLTDKSMKEARLLMKGEVPASWEHGWDGPSSPMDWVILLNQKANSLLNWLQRLQQKQLLEHAVNLNDLFHPETFLNALR
jgi:dynein heavy chain 2